MDDKKRNVTGSYPGAGGVQRHRKNANPSGAYPGRKPNFIEEQNFEPKIEKSVAESRAPENSPVPKKKKFHFSTLFSKETMQKYWKTMAYYSCIFIVSVLLATWVCHIGNEVLGLIRPDKEITVSIAEKSSTMAIAKELKSAGLIDHPYVFRLYCKIKKADGKFQFGEYTINCKKDYNQIIAALKKTASNKTSVSFTINPGDTQEDLVTTLCDSLGYCNREALENVLQNYDFSNYSFLSKLPKRNYRLEGYLYPGDYEMYEGESELAVVERVLDRFEEQALTAENKKLISASKYSLDELMTLASIVQKEGGSDLPKAAGVYYNRLKSTTYPYLESQATVAYILPKEHTDVTVADCKTDDPYNTYRNAGLPTGPIANPGADAITAVLSPTATDDLYFVTQSNGTMLFAVTDADHLKNIKKAGKSLRGTGTIS